MIYMIFNLGKRRALALELCIWREKSWIVASLFLTSIGQNFSVFARQEKYLVTVIGRVCSARNVRK